MTATYRFSAPGDLHAICQHRIAMFEDMGKPAEAIAAMAEPFRQWLEPRLADGRYFGVTAEADGADIGHAGGFIADWPPVPRFPISSERGYVFNVHVAPEFRRRGIASEMMARIEDMMIARGIIYVALHASDSGRPLYLDLGWTPTSELSRIFETASDTGEILRK